ncbi:MAG: S-layer homology domain-containing protein [Chloroflexota bacterium]
MSLKRLGKVSVTPRRVIMGLAACVIGLALALSGLAGVALADPVLPVHNITKILDYGTIKDAIAGADPGDTIEVAAGTYLLDQQLHITKNVSIVGAGSGSTIIRAAKDFVGGAKWADTDAMVLVDAGKTFNLSGVTLDGNYKPDGTGNRVAVGILSHGSGTIRDCVFTNIVNPPPAYGGIAIVLHGEAMTIDGNTFSNIGRIGVYTGFGSVGTITGNRYLGKPAVDGQPANGLDYAFEVGRDGKAIISGNTITDCTAVAATDGSTSAGILVTTYYGTAEATITDNTITGCTTAVSVGYDENDKSVVTIHQNRLAGNEYGVINSSPDNNVDATGNWWGVSTASGIADLTAGAVTYDPWYTDASMTTHGSAKKVVNATQATAYDTISAAVAAANERDTIVVAAGTYSENVTINKSLTLKGAQAGNDPTEQVPAADAETIIKGSVTIEAGTVTVDGFAFVDDQTGRNFMALHLKGTGVYEVRNCHFVRDTGKTSEELGTLGEKDRMIRAIHIGPASASVTIENNLFTGSAVNVYRNSSWRSAIWSDGVSARDSVAIRNNVFDTNRTALNLDNTVDNITLEGNRFLNNGTHISLGGSPVLAGSWAIRNNEFSMAGTIFNLSGVAASFRLDATGNTYDVTSTSSTAAAKAPSALSLADRFLLESAMVHNGKGGKQGFVRILAREILVDGQGCTIQQAIDLADAGDVIQVAEGTYPETLNIAKPVTIKGAGIGKTVVQPAALLSTGIAHKYDNNMAVAALVNGADGVSLQDMTIDAGGLSANAVVFWNSSTGSLTNVAVANTGWVVNGVQTGQGIAVDAGSGLTTVLDIENCQISGFNKNAIDAINGNGALSGGGDITVNVRGGTITGVGPTEAIAQNGILFWERAGGSVGGSIDGVSISGIKYTKPDDAGSSACAVLLYAVKNGTVSVTNTNFGTTNETAVALDGDTTAVLDARHNYWGKATGPDVSSDIGGADSASRVAYSPWWTNAGMSTEGYLTATAAAGSVVIDGGAAITTNRTVSLAIASNSAVRCAISESDTFSDAPGWQDLAAGGLATTYTVSSGNGTKTVYVKFEDAIGNQWIASDSIRYQVNVDNGGGTPPVIPPIVAGSTSETVTTDGGSVQSGDNLTVTFPAGALSEDVTVTIAPVVENVPPTTGMIAIGNHIYEITAEIGAGDSVTQFGTDIIISFTLTDEELAQIAADGGTPMVFYWDAELGAWIPVPTELDGNRLIARTNHLTTYAVMIKEGMPALTDIKGHWAEKHILKLASLGVVGGQPDGTFAPNADLTREQVAKMLALALNLTPETNATLTFADASKVSSWATGYVSAVVKAGYMAGLPGNLFDPQGKVTRDQFAVIVARALGDKADATGTTTGFIDDQQIPSWAKAEVVKAVKAGIIAGLPGNVFAPAQACTRAEAAKMLSLLIDIVR